jgi:hypothetical protein
MSFAPIRSISKIGSSGPSPSTSSSSVSTNKNDWFGTYAGLGLVGVFGLVITEMAAKKVVVVNGKTEYERSDAYVPLMSSFGGLLVLLLILVIYRNFVMAKIQ